MRLDEILAKAGKHKRRKRVGRSGQYGKTCGRGHKGAGQRAGASANFGMEGGQNPALARIPKRGFNNVNFTRRFQVVNVADLEEAFEDGARVDAEALLERRLIRRDGGPVKVLGDGKLSKKLTVVADAFSKSAAETIAAAGGTTETVS
jgi:large subunit ribosomal protein L15